MLDIDFLQSAKPQVRQHLIYSYDTALLRVAVRQRLIAIYTQRGFNVRDADYPDFTSAVWEPSLFGDQCIFIDLDKAVEASKTWKVAAEQLLQDLLAKSIEASVVLFVPESCDLQSSKNWGLVSKAGTFLEEPKPSKANVEKLFKYFATVEPAYNYAQLTNTSSLLQALEEVAAKTEDWSLPEVQSLIHFFATTCVNFEKHEFDPLKFRTLVHLEDRKDFYLLHKLLFEFIQTRQEARLSPLIDFFDKQIEREHKEARYLVAMLTRTTRDLIIVNSVLHPKFETPHGWSEYKATRLKDVATLSPKLLNTFHLALLRNEPALNRTNFIVALHTLGHEFIRRAEHITV